MRKREITKEELLRRIGALIEESEARGRIVSTSRHGRTRWLYSLAKNMDAGGVPFLGHGAWYALLENELGYSKLREFLEKMNRTRGKEFDIAGKTWREIWDLTASMAQSVVEKKRRKPRPLSERTRAILQTAVENYARYGRPNYKEIMRIHGLSQAAALTALSRLYRRGLLEKRGPYGRERLPARRQAAAGHPLVEEGEPLVRTVAAAYKMAYPHLDFDDLYRQGTKGLYRAVELFDDTRGTPFTAYARKHVTGSILDYVKELQKSKRKELPLSSDSSRGWRLPEAGVKPAAMKDEALQERLRNTVEWLLRLHRQGILTEKHVLVVMLDSHGLSNREIGRALGSIRSIRVGRLRARAMEIISRQTPPKELQ